jgi:tetratricopeptide (TPR) repeat protein
LIRDVAYAQIPRAARARKHRQVAEWTEALAGDRVADHGELIAHHYRQALELTRAAGETRGTSELEAVTGKFVEMAGDRALGLDAKRAAEHFGLALDLLPAGSDRRAPLLVKMAEVAARNGQFEEAERTYRDAIEELLAQGDPRSAAGAMVKLANLYWHRGETARGRELTGEAIAVLEREEPGPELIAAHTEQANDYMVLGLYEEALQSAKRALSLMEMLGIREQAPNALSVQGMARWYMGDPTGVDDLRAALDMATAMGIGRDAARLQAILGEFIWVTEGPEAGMKATDEAIDIAEHRGNADLAMAFRAERLWPLFDLGRWDELLADAEELTTWSRTSGEGYFSVVAAVSAAQVLVYRGQVEQAAELARSFLPSARQIEDPQVLVQALAVTALIERYAGEGDRAIELVEEFERITRQRPTWFRAKEIPDLVRVCAEMQALSLAAKLLEGPPVHARRHQLSLLTARAVLEEAAGELDAALRTYAEGVEGWAAFGFALERGRTTLGAGRCLVGLGRSEAIERLSEARSVFTTLGAAALVAETDAWVARAPARIS